MGHLEVLAAARIRSVGGVPAEKHETYSGGYDPIVLRALSKRDASRETAFLVPYLRPSMHVLDCGCGPGGISLGLARLLPEGRVIGIDVEESQLEIGRREARDRGLDNVELKQASVYDIPFEDSTFDAVLAHAVLYHLGDRLKALRDLRRVLKPGGLIDVTILISGQHFIPYAGELARKVESELERARQGRELTPVPVEQ